MTASALADTDPDRLASDALARVQRRWLALDDRWRRADRLWRFRSLAVPHEPTQDHRRQIVPPRHVFAAVQRQSHPVPVGMGHARHDPGAVPRAWGEVEAWELTPDGLVATAVSCIQPAPGWGVSHSAVGEADQWSGLSIVVAVDHVVELSLLPPPMVPAMPSARVLEVEEVPPDGR